MYTLRNGLKAFGFFRGLVYGDREYSEDLDVYRNFENNIDRNAVLEHMRSAECGLCPICGSRADILDGEEFDYIGPGIYEDGPYTFPTEFLHYYEKYNLGIPPEYEEYLKSIGVGESKEAA